MGDHSAYPEAIADEQNLPDRAAHVDIVTAADHNAQSGFIRDITKTLGINPHGAAADVAARFSAIDTLLASPSAPAHTVTVGKSGAMFTTIQAAINSITDNNPGEEYLILVFPGVYTENLTLKQNVHIKAYFKEVTQLNGKASLPNEGDGIIYFDLHIATNDNNALDLNGGDTAFTLLSDVDSYSGNAVNLLNQQFFAKGVNLTGNTHAINAAGSYIQLRNCSLNACQNNAAAHAVLLSGGSFKAAHCNFYSNSTSYALYSVAQLGVYINHSLGNKNFGGGIQNQILNSYYGYAANAYVQRLLV